MMRIKSRIKYLKILGFTLRTLRLCGRIISRKGAKFAKKELKRQLKFQPLIHINDDFRTPEMRDGTVCGF